jgi:hypothetical protein
MSAGLTRIAVLDNEIEAQALGAILEQLGISHSISSFYDTAFDGLFQAQKGWGAISAPAEHADQINQILAELRSPNPADESAGSAD